MNHRSRFPVAPGHIGKTIQTRPTELKAATMVHCEFCIDFGSQVMRRWRVLGDEELLALPNYRTSTEA